MKTIKFYPSNRSLIRLDGKLIKGYKLNDVPYERNSWFNYKGLTFVIDQCMRRASKEGQDTPTISKAAIFSRSSYSQGMGFSWYDKYNM